MDGLLIVDKPAGITSRRVVDVVRRLTGERRMGHGGTLDPLAEGVLVIAMGVATRLLEYVTDESKRYEASVVLGATSQTDDAEGLVTVQDPAPSFTREAIEATLARFRGPIVQRPPAYSAVSVGGRRLYSLARSGAEVEAPERTVTLHELDLV